MSILSGELAIYDSDTKLKFKYPIYPSDNKTVIKEKIQFQIECLCLVETLNITNSKTDPSENKLDFTKRIYYHSVLNYISQKKLLQGNPLEYTNTSSKAFNDYYDEISKIFKEISKRTLASLISVVLSPIFPGEFEDSFREIREYVNIERNSNRNKHGNKTRNIILKNQDIINTNGDVYSYATTILLPVFNLKKSDNSNIDIYKVLKEIKLSDSVPFVYTIDPNINKPVSKVFKDLPKSVTKQFLFNNSGELKRPKGLTFKILSDTGDYSTGILTRDSKLLIKLGKTEGVINYLPPVISRNINGLIKRITGKTDIKGVVSYAKIIVKTNITIDPSKLKQRESVSYSLPKDSQLNITISDVKNNDEINKILNSIVKEISKLNYKKFKKLEEKVKTDLNLKKNYSCQKLRRPSILKQGEIPETYILEYNGDKLVCNSKEKHKYPGFTVNNIPCCFLKDQRTKEIFINNTSNIESEVTVTDQVVLSKRMIKTDKVLGIGSYGVLPSKLEELLNDSFVRIGTNRNTSSSFIDAVSYTVSKKIKIKINEELFENLENGEISKNFNDLNDFLNYIKEDNHIYLVDLVSRSTKKNVVVFSEDKIECLNYPGFLYKEYILVYKNKQIYEPVCKIVNDKIQKKFTQEEIKKFLDVYSNSCKIEYLSPTKEKLLTVEEIGIENIKFQILNKYNNISFVVTERSGLVSVAPRSKLQDTPVESLKNALLPAEEQYAKNKKGVSSQILSEGLVVALVEKTGLMVPVIPGRPIVDLVVNEDAQYFDTNYYTDIATYSKEFTEKEIYQRFRYLLSQLLTEENLLSISKIKRINKSETKMIEFIRNLLEPHINFASTPVQSATKRRNNCSKLELKDCTEDPYCSRKEGKCLLSVRPEKYQVILQKLAFEILNNNKSIINKKIKTDFFDTTGFTKRPTEIPLLTPDDLSKYFLGNQ